jgi:alpha-tubulin suppressor-like RCC1 family protein
LLIKLQKGEYSMNRLKSASLIFVSLAFMTSVVVNTPAIQTNATTVTLNENERVVNIELGGFFTIAMTNQNRIFAWGRNDRGQLGVASPSSSNVPIDISSRFPFISEETIVDIKLGFEHALALSSTGRVFSWGSSNAYENSFSFNVNIPTIITGITFNAGEVVTKIAAGGNSSIILTSENRLFAFGNGEAGQLVGSSSFNAPKNISSSFSLDVGETFVDIELGSAHSSFITSNNRVFMMGDNRSGQIGNDYQGGNFSRSPVKDRKSVV